MSAVLGPKRLVEYTGCYGNLPKRVWCKVGAWVGLGSWLGQERLGQCWGMVGMGYSRGTVHAWGMVGA